jgi:hypothetical protein
MPQSQNRQKPGALQVGQPFNPFRLFTGIFIPEALVRSSLVSPGAKSGRCRAPAAWRWTFSAFTSRSWLPRFRNGFRHGKSHWQNVWPGFMSKTPRWRKFGEALSFTFGSALEAVYAQL